MFFEFSQTVTRLRRAPVPGLYGGAPRLPDWGDLSHPPEETQISGVVIAPSDVAEKAGVGREIVTDYMSLLGPVDIDLAPSDRVRDGNGVVYEVIGHPRRFSSPFTGWDAGSETALRIYSG